MKEVTPAGQLNFVDLDHEVQVQPAGREDALCFLRAHLPEVPPHQRAERRARGASNDPGGSTFTDKTKGFFAGAPF